MAKRKAASQIGNLTPDHKMSRIDAIPMRTSGVQHTLDESYNFALDLVSIGGLSTKL
jgi:hypothetical protein